MNSRSGSGGLTRGALYKDDGATLDDLREAVTTLEETERIRAARARWRAPDHDGDR